MNTSTGMGTKIDCKSYYSMAMRDLNEDSSSSSWPLHILYGDKTIPLPNGHYYNGFMPRNLSDNRYSRHALKQKILEHEAVFKNQLSELHRLYRIQQDMMEEVKRKELHSMESASSSSSSSLQGSQMPIENAKKWHMAGFPLLSCSKGNNTKQPIIQIPMDLDSRPSKVRKKLFDLRLPASRYIDTEEGDYKVTSNGHRDDTSSMELFLRGDGPIDVVSASTCCLRGLADDLNEPSVQIEEARAPSYSSIDFLSRSSENLAKKSITKSNASYLGGAHDRFLINTSIESRYEPGSPMLPFHTVRGMLNHREDLHRGGLEYPNNTHLFNASSFPSSSSSSSSSTLKAYAQSQEAFGGKWHINGSSRSKQVQVQFPSANHGFVNAPSCAYTKPVIDINLNEVAILQDLNMTDGNCKPSNQFSCKNEPVGDLNQLFVQEVVTLTSCDIAETQTVKKILGVPIFENALASVEAKKVNNERIIDINIACEADEEPIAAAEEHEKQKNGTSMRELIDLNSCVSECEEATCYESVKITLEIDLEVPVFMESEDEYKPLETKKDDDEVRNAAQVIFGISNTEEDEPSLEESLMWFVDAVVSFSYASGKEIDDFEAMTLQLPETKEEDYMPKPFVPEVEKDTGGGSNALTSSRSSRRGRQRRDFQRDILPGLASLSRHEVTEDIQTFGGLMRATGHVWNSGLARRNSNRTRNCNGGRRRAVESSPSLLMHQLNKIETGLEAGWGKTTRRPRRQRCPAAAVALT